MKRHLCHRFREICFKQIRLVSYKESNIKNRKPKAQLPIFQYVNNNNTNPRIYVWGYVHTGALGLGINTNTKSEVLKSPKRLPFAEKYIVTNVACGFGFTVYSVKSSNQNKLFGTGINTDSQIGYHNQKNQNIVEYPLPIILPIKDETEILKISAGRAHLLILTTEGLFTLGNNSYGQCGRPILDTEQYFGSSLSFHVAQSNEMKIIDIQCGPDHSLFLTEDGKVLSCGWGADGQTGLGHYNVISQFTHLAGDIKNEKIVKLSCVGDCILAINDKGELFGWGNNEYGQLLENTDQQQINTPIKLKNSNHIGKIVDVAAGGSFCMALNDEGNVFVWGYGLLGKGPEVQQSHKPLLIPPILFGNNEFQSESKVASISCGVAHMGAVTNFGDLYMWGKNKSGCLGLGHKNDQYFPLKISIGATVEKIFCGLDHTVALCKSFI